MIGRVSDIDIRLLRVFVAVVDAGGFSLAVPRLNVAESTVSQHMSDLEKRIGMRLCERGRGGFRVTRDGAQVYTQAIQLLDHLEHFRDELSSIKNELSGTLRVGLTDGLITEDDFRVAERLTEFAELQPTIKLEITIRSPRLLERAVYDGESDIAIGAQHRRVSGLGFKPLFEERNNLYCGRANPLFERDEADISSRDIAQQKRLARGYLDRFDSQFFPEQGHAATVHHIEAAAMLILKGTFVGFLPDHYARPYVEKDELRVLRPDVFTFRSSIGLITKSDRKDEPRSMALSAFLRSSIPNPG